MMELIRTWLIGITCAAMIIAVADSLTPNGAVRKIGRLVGGLVLLIAVVKPLMSLDYSVMAMAAAGNQIAAEHVDSELEKTNLELMKSIIGEKTGAYILDKAESLGASCQSVTVTCEVGEENIPYPSAVTITGNLNAEQRKALSRQIEADLAIPEEHQTYENGDVGT
ncbi:MAG: stage III sporulation protein AF [Clostridia bacterium]|nr:stage III sporulation protein AF [Clostridia bacterium]